MQDAIKCCHNIDNSKTTLVKLPRRYLVYPEIVEYFCPVCKEAFKYTKNINGVLEKIK